MGDVAKGTWVKIKSGVMYKGEDLSGKLAIVTDSESYLMVELADSSTKVKLLRTEVAEYLQDEPAVTYGLDEDDWQFTF